MGIEKPPHVRKAVVTDNLEALRVSGSVGGRKTAEKRRRQRALAERERILAEQQAEQDEWERMKSANEHIIPPPSPFGD